MQQLQKFETPTAILGCFSKSRLFLCGNAIPAQEEATQGAAVIESLR